MAPNSGTSAMTSAHASAVTSGCACTIMKHVAASAKVQLPFQRAKGTSLELSCAQDTAAREVGGPTHAGCEPVETACWGERGRGERSGDR